MPPMFSNILLPTDFSDVALPAVECAKQMARVFDARLHCLHVVDDAYLYWGAVGPESLPIGPPPDEMVKSAADRLARFCAEHFADAARPPVTHVALGRPFYEIVTYARENAVDLIVIGTHGRGAIAQVLLGSTTDKIIRKAPCAVLTVRPKDHRFEMP